MDIMSTAQLLGNVGEFVGAIAVVVTLVYLAVQVRQNSKSLRASGYQDATRMANEWSQLFINNPEVQDLFRRGVSGYLDLDPAERIEFTHIASILFRNYSVTRNLTQEGFIPDSVAGIYQNNILSMFSQPGMRDWWNDQRKHGNVEFEKHVDSLVARASMRQR